MIIGRDLVEYYEDEKLFSTGNDELDEILEEVYYSGLEDGYDYAQREFAEVDSEGTKWVKELHTPRKKQTKESAKIAKRKLRNEDRADRRDTFRGYMKDYEDFAGDVHKNSILREEAKNLHRTADNVVDKGLDYANKAGGRAHETFRRSVPEPEHHLLPAGHRSHIRPRSLGGVCQDRRVCRQDLAPDLHPL